METPDIKETLQAEGYEVEDLSQAWGKVLRKAEAANPDVVSVAGSARRAAPSDTPAPASALRGKDLEPFIKALGGFACRVARVAPMTIAEASQIAEPGASVLNKWAPNVAQWVPEMTLVTAVSDFVESRSAEYKSAHPPTPGAVPETGPKLVEPGKF